MKNILLFILTFFSFGLSAQLITVSEEINLSNDANYDILGELGRHILLFRDDKTRFEVQAFNPELRESWSKPITLDKRLPKVLGTISEKESFSILYSFRQKGSTLVKLHRYDPAANLLDSATVLDLGFLFFTPRFEVVRSEDRSKLLLYYTENQEIIHAFAIDVPTQSLLWKTTVTPNDFLYHRDFGQALINNRANMSLVLSRDNFRSKRKNHYFEIFSFNGSGSISVEQINMGDFITYDVLFEADNLNQQLAVAGLYSLDNSDRSEGTFYFTITSNTPGQTKIVYNKFEESFLLNLLNKDYREGKGLKNSSVRELVIRRDGGVLLVVEQNYEYQRRTGTTARTNYGTSGARMMIDFYFEEVFILSIHPDGTQHWETILHKKQYSQDDNGMFSSYFLFETPGKLRFLFNDEISHENTVSEYVIDGLGHSDRNSLFSTANLDLRLRFRDALQIGPNSLIIPSERRNRLKLVRLDY